MKYEELEQIFKNAPLGIALVDKDLCYISCNEVLAEMNGISSDDHIGRSIYEVAPDVVDYVAPMYRKVLDAGESFVDVIIARKAKDSPNRKKYFYSNYFPIKTENDDITCVCMIIKEVTQYKEIEDEVQRQQKDLEKTIQERTTELSKTNIKLRNEIAERQQLHVELLKLSRAVEASSSLIVITDLDGYIEYVNPKCTAITGFSKEDLIGQHTRILRSGKTPESVYIKLWEIIRAGGEWRGELHNQKKDGSGYWARASVSCVRDEKGNITHFIGIHDDVTQEYEMVEQLSYQASHDSLTGLINRREFERRAERLLSTTKEDKDMHALCYLDMDQFKVVNDTCGHMAGDELLRQLSMILQDIVRHRDTLARLGGDEFGILMEHCSLEQANRVATSIQQAIQNFQFNWKEHTFRVGMSMGLVAITETVPNLSELLKQADAACYMAKDLGRNRIHIYHGEDEELAQRQGEMQWVERIQLALAEDRFCLYAQTIIPLDNSTDKRYELLIRMIDEKEQIIQPGAFLPAAERYHLITMLDKWVIKHAFALLAAHPVFLDQIEYIAINLSGHSLADKTFQEFVIEQLDVKKVHPGKICFEITETAAISNLGSANVFISEMNALGCRFALDDFGSGLSSFAYLKQLPVDYLKIDGMFVKDIVSDAADHAMVKSINEIGQVMGKQTIAEFVENDEIKGMLREIGVNYAQGYGIGMPMTFEKILGRATNITDINHFKSDRYLS